MRSLFNSLFLLIFISCSNESASTDKLQKNDNVSLFKIAVRGVRKNIQIDSLTKFRITYDDLMGLKELDSSEVDFYNNLLSRKYKKAILSYESWYYNHLRDANIPEVLIVTFDEYVTRLLLVGLSSNGEFFYSELAGFGGDGGYSFENFGKFISDSVYVKTKITRLFEENNIKIDTVYQKILFDISN